MNNSLKTVILTLVLLIFVDPGYSFACVANGPRCNKSTVNQYSNANCSTNVNNNKVDNINNLKNENLNNQDQIQNQSQINQGNQNEINISDNSVYTENYPTELLNPQTYVPLSNALDEDYLGKSVFDFGRTSYKVPELVQFANPVRFLGFLWPEWEKTYTIELATFGDYKRNNGDILVVKSTGAVDHVQGRVKIGEAQAFATDLNKSQHQVMAALAVKSAEAGANLVVFKTFSTSLVKVNSFVIGGGGVQAGSVGSTFNGATGVGSSQSEKKARSCVIAELYR